MYKRALLAGAIIVGFTNLSAGAPSDDLVFCSKLGDRSERLACFEAAARIAEVRQKPAQAQAIRSERVVATPVATDAYAKAPTSEPLLERRPFHGAHLSIGGSYGITEPVFAFPMNDQEQLKGSSVIGAAGYNVQYGPAVFGAEIAGRYGWEQADHTAISVFTTLFPGLGGHQTTIWRFYSDASMHLSAKAGLAVDDTMVFVRAGAGVAHLKTTINIIGAGSLCAASTVAPPTFQPTCVQTTPIPSSSSRRSEWHPSVLVGAGIEHNFGRFFGRFSAEGEAIHDGSADAFWIARAVGSIGVRF